MKNPISKFKKLIVAGTLFALAGTLYGAQASSPASTPQSPLLAEGETPSLHNFVDFAQNAKKAPKPKGFKKTLLGTKFLLNPNIKKNAKFYIVLCSASWCGPCQREMPIISKGYTDEIKDLPTVELVLLSFDRTPDAMKAWAEKEKIEFPVAMDSGAGTIFGSSVATPQGIPYLYIFKADGKLVKSDRADKLFKEWKNYCK